MPDSPVSPGANGGRIDLSSAPGADVNWDDLFPNPETTALAPQAPSGTTPQQQPQATQSQPFLQAGSTVYNTAEDAVRGTQHKDDLIARYRSYLSTQGVDPNTLQRTAPEPQAQPTQTAPSKYKYYGNPNFFDEVAKAAADHDRAKYEQLLAVHSREAAEAAIDERLAPWQPTLAETNRYKAFRQVTQEIPGFQNFFESPGFKEVQDKFPLYKETLQICENNPQAAQRLPEVYQQMYVLYQGLNAGRSQAQPQTTPTTPTVRSQPTLQPSSLTPPAPASSTAGWAEASWRGNRSLGNEARKQLIQDGDTKFRNMRFEDAGL
jgi:hypothetical protein